MATQNKLHANKFEDLILRRGREVLWRESIVCSCLNLDSGQPQEECKVCGGKGFTLSEPVRDIVLVQSVTHNKEFEEMVGLFEIGDAVMSVGALVPVANLVTGLTDATKPGRPNPIFHCGMYDLITLTDDEYKTSEVLVKGQRMYARDADTLINDHVLEVRVVRSCDPDTGAIIDYVKDYDYTFEDNRIVWVQDTDEPSEGQPNRPRIAPSEGEQYSVQYTHRPTFTILKQLPTPRYQDKQHLPKRVMLRYVAGGMGR